MRNSEKLQNWKLLEMYFQFLTLQKIQLAIALTLYFGRVHNTQYLRPGNLLKLGVKFVKFLYMDNFVWFSHGDLCQFIVIHGRADSDGIQWPSLPGRVWEILSYSLFWRTKTHNGLVKNCFHIKGWRWTLYEIYSIYEVFPMVDTEISEVEKVPGLLSPPQRIPLGIQIKIAIIDK